MRSNVIALTVVAILGSSTASIFAQGFGSIKGQVVWGEDKVPEPRMLKVDKDQDHCGNGITSNELIIDAKTKGVKNVIIWLDSLKMDGVLPIHPALAAVPKDVVKIDQPKCLFEPRVVAFREGQILQVFNTSPKAHNSKILGKNATKNPLIPPGGQVEIKDLKAEARPYLLGCDIHGWMAGRIGVFKHPYFFLSKADGTFEIKDIPAGDVLLYMQHEVPGWVHKGGKNGQKITIKAGETLDLGKIMMKNAD
jgi:hypothetical protein